MALGVRPANHSANPRLYCFHHSIDAMPNARLGARIGVANEIASKSPLCLRLNVQLFREPRPTSTPSLRSADIAEQNIYECNVFESARRWV